MLSRRWLTRLVGAAAVLSLAISCATGTVAEDDDGGSGASGAGGPNGPLPGYQYRQGLTIADATAADVPVPFELDHATLVTDGKARADGRDLRITYETPDGMVVQIDRALDPGSTWNDGATQLWVRTTAAVDGSGAYYIYYGKEDAGAAPADATKVYDYWDDFEDGALDPGWVFSGTNGATGMVTEQGGALRVTATAQNFGGTSDQIGLAMREFNGDFRVDMELRAAGGSLGGLSKAGGLSLRQSNAAGARHMTIAIQQTPNKRVRLFRGDDNATTTTAETDNLDPFPYLLRLDRIGNQASVAYQTGGVWLQLDVAQAFTTPLVDPVFVGVPVANLSGDNGWAEVEWMRLNRTVTPAPTAAPDGMEQEY